MPEKACHVCGKLFNGQRKESKYCSQACCAKAKERPVFVQCKECGKTFKTLKYVVGYRGRKFCSTECYKKSVRPGVISIKCDHCGKTFQRVAADDRRRVGKRGVFCSQECYKREMSKRAMKAKCQNCGRTFVVKRGTSGKFCTMECFGEARSLAARKRYKKRLYGYKGVKVVVGKYSDGRTKYSYAHVLQAEKAIGRKLTIGECVHHINGDKTDNRNKNLLVTDLSFHNWLHQRMSHMYQQEHFKHI